MKFEMIYRWFRLRDQIFYVFPCVAPRRMRKERRFGLDGEKVFSPGDA
jgi:hypothetical protein